MSKIKGFISAIFKVVLGLFAITSIGSVALALPTSIVYFAYSWAHNMAVNLALWEGVKLFLTMFLGGGIIIVVSITLIYVFYPEYARLNKR